MIHYLSEPMIIGVDHGFATMKTAHSAFPSGLVAFEHEPYTQANVLEYGEKYYIAGSGRQPLQKDKTQREDYYLLTLAAVARELAYRHAERTACVHLAAGLPLTSFGREKKTFKAYLFREGRLVQLTHDDSYVQQLVDAGRLTEGEAARHRDRNLLVRALGTEPYTDFGFEELTLDSGDRILLCSDGLSACRSDRDIAGFLRLADPCRETAEALICAAKDAGGPDNITVILADI